MPSCSQTQTIQVDSTASKKNILYLLTFLLAGMISCFTVKVEGNTQDTSSGSGGSGESTFNLIPLNQKDARTRHSHCRTDDYCSVFEVQESEGNFYTLWQSARSQAAAHSHCTASSTRPSVLLILPDNSAYQLNRELRLSQQSLGLCTAHPAAVEPALQPEQIPLTENIVPFQHQARIIISGSNNSEPAHPFYVKNHSQLNLDYVTLDAMQLSQIHCNRRTNVIEAYWNSPVAIRHSAIHSNYRQIASVQSAPQGFIIDESRLFQANDCSPVANFHSIADDHLIYGFRGYDRSSVAGFVHSAMFSNNQFIIPKGRSGFFTNVGATLHWLGGTITNCQVPISLNDYQQAVENRVDVDAELFCPVSNADVTDDERPSVAYVNYNSGMDVQNVTFKGLWLAVFSLSHSWLVRGISSNSGNTLQYPLDHPCVGYLSTQDGKGSINFTNNVNCDFVYNPLPSSSYYYHNRWYLTPPTYTDSATAGTPETTATPHDTDEQVNHTQHSGSQPTGFSFWVVPITLLLMTALVSQ